jgi:Acetyltransferases
MIRYFEELTLNAWPAVQTRLYDGWLLRFADGYTKRANSVNPIYQFTLPLAEKIQYCEYEYQKQNLPAVYKLTADSPPELDRELEKGNYMRFDETAVRLLDMNHYRYRKPAGIIIENEFSDDWFRSFISCSNLENPKFQSAARNILHNISGEIVVISKKNNDKIIGCGFGAIERGNIGIFDIIVDRNHRGKGYGLDIMDGILSVAADKKMKNAYLSVIVGNVPAQRLYEKIGFQEIYHYWYRQKNIF